jgi:hypothetical protein
VAVALYFNAFGQIVHFRVVDGGGFTDKHVKTFFGQKYCHRTATAAKTHDACFFPFYFF